MTYGIKRIHKETITQIADDLREGHQYIEENGYGYGVKDDRFKEISFDVAITSNEEETTGIGGKISVVNVLNIGGKGENISKASNVSRIQFKVDLHVKTKK